VCDLMVGVVAVVVVAAILVVSRPGEMVVAGTGGEGPRTDGDGMVQITRYVCFS